MPIRKFLIIFYIYLRYLFGRNPQQGDVKSAGCGEFKDLKYLKVYAESLITDEEPARFLTSSAHPVEMFYKRNMSVDHPIPQVIVVGILRVLLTTCPNNPNTQKQGSSQGGVDLHSEWNSCLDLLNQERDLF